MEAGRMVEGARLWERERPPGVAVVYCEGGAREKALRKEGARLRLRLGERPRVCVDGAREGALLDGAREGALEEGAREGA